MSLTAVASHPVAKVGLFVGAIAALVLTLIVDRRAATPLLPSDAFSLHSATGIGLWLTLLVSIAYSPLQIFVPIFLQVLHGLDPLSAGYMVAGASGAGCGRGATGGAAWARRLGGRGGGWRGAPRGRRAGVPALVAGGRPRGARASCGWLPSVPGAPAGCLGGAANRRFPAAMP